MRSVLKQLYEGDIRPEEMKQPVGKEYAQLKIKIQSQEESLAQALDGKLNDRFEELMELFRQAASLETEDAYIQGMQMGAQLALELLGGRLPPAGLDA